MKKLLIALVAVAILAASVVVAAPASAATARTVTLTEAQANQLYIVTNPYNRAITSRVVDFQPTQVVISTSFEYRAGKTANTVTTIVPVISNGRLSWRVTSRARNGEAVPQDVINQINTSISTSWRNWVKGKLPTGKITSVTISDVDMVIAYTTAR
ncbi:MAG: hypothetical protein KF716_29680 [Anaerolineae bacterium]|nr:hypothetical protein [Anaerolineae bacterium]